MDKPSDTSLSQFVELLGSTELDPWQVALLHRIESTGVVVVAPRVRGKPLHRNLVIGTEVPRELTKLVNKPTQTHLAKRGKYTNRKDRWS